MLQLIEEERGTVMLNVPTMLTRLLDHPSIAERDISTLRLVSLGGALVPPELARRAAAIGMKAVIGYGQTEASPYLTHTAPDDPNPDWASTVGRPLPQTEIKIVHPTTGATLPHDTVGEICARGYCVMKGYLDDSQATASALDADGWLHTGDLGSMDRQGYLRIQGRLKELIIRGGENIYPREIEDILHEHPSVAGVSVVGVPDREWGEVVAAFVLVKNGHERDAHVLEAFCRARLASYKVPRIWRFVEQFPQTASGKVQKHALRDIYLAWPR